MRKQIAICIGNDDYLYPCLPKLDCAVSDAASVSDKLKTLGYDTILHTNLNRGEMHIALDEFESLLPDYDVALFYFAGHGFECDGHNLLMPVDTNATDRGYREWMALPLDSVIDTLQGKQTANTLKTKIIILDACRQNPDGRGIGSVGFAPVFAPAGTIIAYSTSPGQIAIERNGHGLYTNSLLSCIDMPRIPIENMFKHVRGILAAASSGRQISWEHTSLIDNYYFNEDRIDSFVSYQSEAYADSEYYVNKATAIGSIIARLKRHDWYTQNPAVAEIFRLPFCEQSASDLFVLGRNIYQAACGGAWSASGFIRAFQATALIPVEAKNHILNGMAYEIYFNSRGALRTNFKTGQYLDIIGYLENDMFQSSKHFVAGCLAQHPDNVIYVPGSETRLELHIVSEAKELEEENDVILHITHVFCFGKNILHYCTNFDNLPFDSYAFSSATKLTVIRNKLAQAMVAPPDMILLTSNIEETEHSYFKLPHGFSLRNDLAMNNEP